MLEEIYSSLGIREDRIKDYTVRSLLFFLPLFMAAMAMDRPIYSVRVNPIHGNGIDTYCKISQYEYTDDSKSSYTLSFGTGKRYCLTVSINGMDYSTAYIDRVDRVDRVEACSKGGVIQDYEWNDKNGPPRIIYHYTNVSVGEALYVEG